MIRYVAVVGKLSVHLALTVWDRRRCVAMLAAVSQELEAEKKESKRLRDALMLDKKEVRKLYHRRAKILDLSKAP